MSQAVRLFLRANRRQLLELLLASAVVNGFLLSLPLFSMLVYDKAMGNEIHDTLWALATGMLLLLGLEIALRVGRVMLVEHAGARWDAHLDERLMRGILATPISKPLPVGELLSRYRELAGARDFLSAQFLLPLADFPFLLLFAAVITVIGGPLVLVPLGIGALLLGTTTVLQALGQRRQRVASAAQSSKMTWLVDVLSARESLMSNQAATVAAARYRMPAATGARAAAQARMWSQVAQQVVPVTMTLATVAMLVAGVFRVEAQALSVGGLISCNLLASRMLSMLCSAAPVALRWKEFQRALHGLMGAVAFDVAPVGAVAPASDALAGEGIRLDDVGVRYAAQQRAVLEGLTLHLRPGEMVAVVGASGAGKSTLLRLLAGHLSHTSGQLAFAGHRIDADAQRRWLCSQVHYKPQDPCFLRGTLAEIVAPGAVAPSDAALAAALRRAGFGPVLDRGELGLASEVGTNGAGLSGGQRQMLALARALYVPADPAEAAAAPQVLLLDEPTLGLDRPAQEQLLREFASLKAGRCLVVATHATEVIQCADRVLVLDRGRLVADAPPGRLLGAHAGTPARGRAAGAPQPAHSAQGVAA